MKYKKRLIVFCIYNRNGVISADTEYVLQQLEAVADRLFVVVNGSLLEGEKRKLTKYTQNVRIRENYGYDYGAYREILQKSVSIDELKQFDSLILCNDTFYGFFEPIHDILEKMDEKKLDIWGMNRLERGLLNHISSYFLVFDRNVYEDLIIYLENHNLESGSYGEIAAYMEPLLYYYFQSRGYRIGCYKKIDKDNVTANPYRCIVENGLPILKKKSLNLQVVSEEEIDSVIMYVKKYNLYPKELIQNLKKTDQEVLSAPEQFYAKVTERELFEYAKKDFYIYGAGLLAQELYYTYFEKNPCFKGFVVSDGEEIDREGIYRLKDISSNARIIIGVKYSLIEEIKKNIPSSMDVMELWRV